MLDQSFSAENFREILDYENRKGIFLEGKYFRDIEELTNAIKRCNIEIREKKKIATLEDFETFRRETNEKKDRLKEAKENRLTEELQKISDKIVHDKFKIILTKNDNISDKPVYTTADEPENYFALKQVQYNFKKLYKVKQANRFSIVSQTINLLGDTFPKYVIKTDISDFYESIPHDKLLQKLNEESLLSFYSKKIVFQILNQYKALSGTTIGLPRGIGLSAYLSELYMRNIDKHIQSLPTVSYYARYVDDIIIIFTPTSLNGKRNYLQEIDDIIETKYSLVRNKTKTDTFDLSKPKPCSIDYLGYKISFGKEEIKVQMTSRKKAKYRKRIDLLFDAYINLAKVNEKKARKILVKRLNFLTGNTRLLNNKKNILVGIYYSNNLLSNTADLIGFDSYLEHKINSLITFPPLQQRLRKFKFCDGFAQKRFASFTANELSNIISIWRSE